MTLDRWLEAAKADASKRGLDDTVILLDGLAGSLRALREADWNIAADAACAPSIVAESAAAADPAPVGASVPRDANSAHAAGPVEASAPELQSILQAASRLARGEVTSSELVDACLERVSRLNPSLNAVIAITGDEARLAARDADRDRAAGRVRGPLHGIPVTLKDLIDVAGLPTTAASHVRRNARAARDATVTRRLREAGAILLGKANLHEFAFGTTNEDSAFGPAHHPSDPSRSPGGSSGGSAVAVATGMCFASVGTDTGGSVRIPAAACGIVGLKPGYGEIPSDGVVPLAWSLDHVGALARSVEDAAVLYRVLRGDAPDADASLPHVVPGTLRLRPLEDYFVEILEDAVRAAYGAALDLISHAGVDLAPVTIPHARLTAPVYLPTVLAEAMAYHAPTLDRVPDLYQPKVRVRLELGRYVPGEDYVRAARGRVVLAREVDRALAGAHALVLPTLPIVAPPLGHNAVAIGSRREPVRNLTLRLTQLFDVTGHPAITLPIGSAEPRLPAGLQLVGHRGHTEELLAVANSVEQVLRAAR